MTNQTLTANANDADAVKQLARAITGWDPLLSLKLATGDSLYGGILTSYALSIGGEATVTFRGRSERVAPGDAIVLAPSVRAAVQPAGSFLTIGYEGLAPEQLRGPAGLAIGFELFALARTPVRNSIRGQFRPVLDNPDLKYRVRYDHVTTERSEPHIESTATELYYVLSGDGELRVGQDAASLKSVAVRPGQIVLVGPGLYRTASEGLSLCLWSLEGEMAYRRRVREAEKQ